LKINQGVSMNHTEQRKRLRAIFAGTQCLSPASVYDALSARVAEAVGYKIGMLAGSTSSSTTLAAPDLIVLTLTEFADQVRRIMRACDLSLIVDADHGYGNALNVMRTVQELETAGVAALMIEDTLLPRAFGEAKPSLISLEEGIGKMRAALAARDVLGVVPALGAEGAEGAEVLPLPERTDAVGVVLHQGDATRLEQVEQAVDVDRDAAVVHGEDRTRPVGEGRGHLLDVDVQRVRVHVDQHRRGTTEGHRRDRRREGERRADHLVTRAELEQQRGQLQRVGARRGQQGAGGAGPLDQPVGGPVGELAVTVPHHRPQDAVDVRTFEV